MPDPTSDTRLNVRLSPERHAALKRLAEERGQKIVTLVTRMIDAELERAGREPVPARKRAS